MKKALIGAAAAAALVLSAGAALADGYGSVKDAAPIAPQVNWNGLYIGAAVGYGIASTELDYRKEYWYEGYLDEYGFFNVDGVSGRGFQGIVTLGYDRQIHPNIILGVFGDYAFGDLETEASIGGGSPGESGAIRLDAELTDSWAIGARLGYIHSPATMWYVAAGYAKADLDWKITGFAEGEMLSGSEVLTSGGKSLEGWFIGGGVEHQLRDNLFLKLDYRYTNYDTERLFSYSDGDEYCGESAYLDSDTDVHSIRLGVNWKVDLFGSRHAAADYTPLK